MQSLNPAPRTPGPTHLALARLDPAPTRDRAADADPLLEFMPIHTKTRMPRDCGDTLRRERLEKYRSEVQRRLLTLVIAPPGCGKTTLARQWAEQLARQGAKVAWFSIDPDDNDPLRFMLYLDRAVAGAGFERFAARADAMRHDPSRSFSEMSSALINRVAEMGDELVIVLDNYAWITDAAIHGQVAYILNNAPSNLHVVILASAPPPLPIGRLRARNQLFELNSNAIRFTRSEMQELLGGEGGSAIEPAQLQEIYRFTQGWAAAVRIIALKLDKSGKSSPSGRSLVDCRIFDAVDEYLEELFLGFPDELIDMMMHTSLVDSVSLPLCLALANSENSETYFCQLEQQQILMPLDPDRELFIYPASVRRNMYRKLARKGHHYLAMLHRRAYGWYAQDGQWDKAADHALAAGDSEIALGWMECHVMSILKAGRVGTLTRWHQRLSALPISIPQRVRLAFAWAYALSHALDPALDLLAVIGAFSPQALPPEIQAECDAIRALAYTVADRIDEAAEFAARCAGHRFPDPWIGSIVANVELYCRFRRGQWAAFFSEPAVLAAQGEGVSNTQVLRLSYLGFAALLRGQLGLAEKYCNDALRLSPAEKGSEVLHFSAWPIGLLANVYYEEGRLDELEALLENRMDCIVSSGNLDCTLGAFLAAARTAARKGKMAKALSLLEQAEGIAVKRKWTRLEAAVLLERLRLYVNENRQAEAEGCLRRLSQMPGGAGGDAVSPSCSAAQLVDIARAHFAVHCGRPEEAIAPLQALIGQFSANGNELFAVRLGTLLAIAHAKAGRGDTAEQAFRATVERAEKGGFVSAVIDHGPEAGKLLSRLAASLEHGESAQRLRKHSERMLRDWKRDFEPHPAGEAPGKETGGCSLTPKEHEVLALMANGQSNKEIARNLSVAPETVKTHLKNIFFKLSVERRMQAVAKAQALGLLARDS